MGPNRYVLLTGSRNNAGDFLIKHRAMALLRALRPDRELIDRNAWEPIAYCADCGLHGRFTVYAHILTSSVSRLLAGQRILSKLRLAKEGSYIAASCLARP